MGVKSRKGDKGQLVKFKESPRRIQGQQGGVEQRRGCCKKRINRPRKTSERATG